jgi:hypothetical protein
LNEFCPRGALPTGLPLQLPILPGPLMELAGNFTLRSREHKLRRKFAWQPRPLTIAREHGDDQPTINKKPSTSRQTNLSTETVLRD